MLKPTYSLQMIFLLGSLVFFSTLTAQNALPVKNNGFELVAKVVDDQQKAIEIGNVMLLSLADSTLIKGDLFYDGQLKVSDISHPSFLLKISALGYQDFYQIITHTTLAKALDLGTLQLPIQTIEGVEVVARKAMFEQRGTDLIVNVENTALSSAGTAMDVIQNAPKVFVSRGGQISIIGKGNALVYLDGQPVINNQILQNLSANDIKTVEIIENPSAKYEAAGRAVINIITKTKTLEGFKIGLLQQAAKAKFFRAFFQADTYYKLDKLMLQASYGIRPWAWGGRNQQTRYFDQDNAPMEIDNYFVQKNTRLDHSFNVRSLYQLTPTSKIGVQFTGGLVDGDKDAINLRSALINQQPAFDIDSRVTGPFQQYNNTVNAFYQNSLDTLGSNLQVTAQYANFRLDRNEFNEQVFSQQNTAIQTNRRSINDNNIDIYTMQLDYQKHFKNKLIWENGLKNAYITNSSSLLLELEGAEGDFTREAEFSNEYEYDENILAGYSQINWQLDKVKITAGLRGEWTQMDGTSGDLGEGNLISRRYFDLFPSATISQTVNESLKTSVSYSRRISRPLFQDLNPYVFYVDSLISLRGNPNLVPEYSHALSGNINYKKWNLNLNYTYTKDKVNQIFRSLDLDQPSAIAFIKENLRHTKLYGADLSYPINTKWYNAYFTVGFFYDDHQIPDIDNVLKNDKAGYYFQVNQFIQLPAKFNLDTYFKYTSSRVDGPYTDNPISYLNISLSRKFFNNHLKATLWANDVFDKFKFTGTTNFNRMYATYLSEGDWHFIRLSLKWDFGKLGTGSFRDKGVSKAELNRIQRN